MAYQNVWWHSPVEYGAGLQPGHTWPSVYEQYRRPRDERQYDVPVEPYTSKLYYEQPRMGMPVYRGTFRDKPHCVTSHYPSGTDKKPVGFHGRVYYEQLGPTRYGYNGPQKDDLYYLELPPYDPSFPKTKTPVAGKDIRVFEGMNLPQCPKRSTLELTHSMSHGYVVTDSKNPYRLMTATSAKLDDNTKYKTKQLV